MADCMQPIDLVLGGSVKMRFCEIPSAQGALMGTENGESDEKPVVQRNFKQFHMAQFEVTQLQYRTVMKEEPWHRHLNKGVVLGNQNPAVGMLFRRALEFAERVNRLDANVTYRLPTEAEWEYAARGLANPNAKRYWGDEFDADMAFFRGNAKHGQDVTSCPNKTLERGYCANDLGLMHMLGNVWEWTLDKYKRRHNPNAIDGHSADLAHAENGTAAVRGAAFNDEPRRIRSANRFGFWDATSRNVGLRLVRIENN